MCPAEFRSFFEHVRSLRFDDRPDYDYLKRLFRELFFRKGFAYDNMFDWEVLSSMGADGSAPPAAGGDGENLAGRSLTKRPVAPPARDEMEEVGGAGGGAISAGGPSRPTTAGAVSSRA